ncbi:Nucleotidyl transferase domain [Macleaya cordata]|uniref:Nucleotidyl transferase domain n=1 Tax=Macleaya cordata TaxID=56857 RepID=A0A200QLR6_MACCD|nr:Nucleotidyl transferase domain [Macleaya cordata]
MGDHEHWAQPSGLLPNGLLPDTAASVTRVLEPERWSKAEERTAELIDCIQPNKPSEERRSAVADYVQRLIVKCFSCQVFTFGSVPLKTYLPDGDIDLTAFSENETLKDTWANEVRNMLEKEEKSENAEFRVKEVQYIQAEVKIIKCLVENIVVDISFNQLGGLCTLCFLEEVDHLINQNHLFKRSIILIKAWCYYESRILGAHHGLISTYALETLVLYIFHVFNNSFAGPLEVLYRFLEFFSNFDWDNFCLSLWGPVPIRRLPDMTAEPPRKDIGELLLSKLFDACRSVYSVFPGGQENQSRQPFVSKHFNVIDPLRTNNNLGRSVSRGNFFRIRSAFAFGATRLARLLECPKEDLISEVNLFFMNTWDRHGSRHRPDAPSADLWGLQQLSLDHVNGSENLKHHSSSKKKVEQSAGHESEVESTHSLHGISARHGNRPSERMSRTSNLSATSRTQNRKNYGNLSTSRVSDQFAKNANSSDILHSERSNRSSRPDYLMNDVQSNFQFGRTRSSPELTDTSNEVSRGRHSRVPEVGKKQMASARPDYGRRKSSEVSGTHSARSSTDDSSSLRHSSSHQSLDVAGDSNIGSNNYHDVAGFGSMGEELASVAESMEMHQEEQDLVNMMASSRFHGLAGRQVQFPMNLASPHLPLPMTPSVLAPVGYAQRNLTGMIPTDIPLVQPPWGSHMPLPQGLASASLSRYFSTIGLASNQEMIESSTENSGLTETNQLEGDHSSWPNQDAGPGRGFGTDNGGFQVIQSDDKQQSTSVGYNFVPLSRASSSGSSLVRGQHKFSKESKGLVSKDRSDTFQYKYDRGNEVYSTDRYSNLRSLTTSEPGSSRSKTSSESSWDGSSAKVSKSTREKRGRKTTPSVDSSTVYGKVKNGWLYDDASVDNGSSQADDDNKDWIPLSTMQTEMAERSTGSTSVASVHAQSHQIPNYETSHMTGSDSMLPITPMLVGSGSRQRTVDNSGMVPYAFYLTGPPVPFLTMLPVYNIPTETGNAERSTINLDSEEGSDNSYTNQSDHKLDSLESLDQSGNFSSSNVNRDAASMEPTEEHKSDILNSDFTSHWQNLQFGRFCQNPRYHGPLIYPSPVMVPPVYLQGHFPWDGPGRPISANGNLFTQPMNYGPRPIPVSPLQPGSQRPNGVYQRYGDDVPRYRGGTGTYLPNRKVPFRERQSSSIRNHKGNNNYDRNEFRSEREGNWNMSSRQRAPGRGQSRSDKPSSRSDRFAASDNRADRSWDSYRHESFPPYQSQSGSFRPPNSMHSNYSMYPMMSLNSNGAPTGPGVPSVVMLYSYDHNVGYGSSSEQLKFGSLGPVNFSGASEVTQEGEGVPASLMYEQQRFQGGSSVHSSSDEPSSPQSQRYEDQQHSLKQASYPSLIYTFSCVYRIVVSKKVLLTGKHNLSSRHECDGRQNLRSPTKTGQAGSLYLSCCFCKVVPCPGDTSGEGVLCKFQTLF